MTVNSNNSVYSSYGSSSVNASLQRGKPNFEEMANELLASMDSDSNGSIDKAEFSAVAQSMASQSDNTSELDEIFSSLDTDSDGSMSSEELMSALKNMKPAEGEQKMAQGAMPPPPPPPQDEATSSEDSTSSEVFAALDTNEDGSISAEEFQALFADDSSQEEENSFQTNEDKLAQMKKDIFEKILSSYGNSVSTTDTTSLLSISA
ncbi:MAG: EF-hand domain-containing protein [Sulfurimonas sp.]|uniref:EF-hand domain-containing protein n=1 Tax=Sulfurimonas sp. TaxID=2022749 RepID=UPI003D107927